MIVAITTAGKGRNARKIAKAGGWELSVWNAAGDEPRIRDTDLAQRLGFERPRKIREIIKRSYPDKNTRPHVRPTVERTSMPRGGSRNVAVEEFWLTEEEALFVATRSRTTLAVALTKEMIRVYTATRRELYTQPLEITQLAAQVAALTSVVAKLAAPRTKEWTCHYPTSGTNCGQRHATRVEAQHHADVIARAGGKVRIEVAP